MAGCRLSSASILLVEAALLRKQPEPPKASADFFPSVLLIDEGLGRPTDFFFFPLTRNPDPGVPPSAACEHTLPSLKDVHRRSCLPSSPSLFFFHVFSRQVGVRQVS